MSKKRRKKKRTTHGGNREWAEGVARRTGAILRDRPLPDGKFSDIVATFAEPLVDVFAESDEDHVEILHFACSLWNMVLLKKADRGRYAELESAAMAVLSGDPYLLAPVQALNLLSAMLELWEQDFSWCRRIIVDKHIMIGKDRIHISVVSAAFDGLLDVMEEREGMEAEAEAGESEDQSQAGGGVGDEINDLGLTIGTQAKG